MVADKTEENEITPKDDKELTLDEIKSSAAESLGEKVETPSLKIGPIESADAGDSEKEASETIDEDTKMSEKTSENPSKEPGEAELPVSGEINTDIESNGPKSTSEKKSILEPASSRKPKSASGGESRRRNKRVYMFGVIITVIILGATGGVLFFRMRETLKSSDEMIPPVELTPTPTEAPTEETAGVVVVNPTQEEEEEVEEGQLTRGEITVEVLNATDISGHARSSADKLTALGYEVSEVGNSNEDTDVNLLYVNPDYEGKVDLLLEDVETKFNITEVSGPLSNSDASARIVLGE